MAVRTRHLDYSIDGLTFDGAVSSEQTRTDERPGVLVLHGWEGRSAGQEAIAERIASLGYVGIAGDVFGGGQRGDVGGDNSALIEPFLNDRSLLRDRLLGVLRFARSLPEVDADRIAAIGFCFGGLCVLDLARSGADLRAVASFHGVLSRPEGMPVVPISASCAVFHGWEDPLAPPSDVVALAAELTEAGADWQLHAFGHAMHAFMAAGVDQPERGLRFDETAARRAWAGLERLLAETLDEH